MALLWFEGFDQYGSDTDFKQSRKWIRAVGSGILVTGSRSAKAAKTDGTAEPMVLRVPGEPQTVIFGYAAKFSATNGRVQFFSPDGYMHAALTFVTTDTLQLHGNGGGTLLGSAACSISTWHYIEIKLTISSSVGAAEVRLDGSTVINVSGVNTMNASSGHAKIAAIQFGGYSSSTNMEFDDMYLCDNSGSVNNDFLGDCSIGLLVPDGDSSVQLSRSSGSTNYSLVDEYPGDSATTYVYSATAGHKDLYTLTNPPAGSPVIAGAAVCADARVTAGALRQMKLHLNGGGAGSTTLDTPSAHGYRQFVRETHDGSNAWTVSALNSAVAGIEVV